MPQKEFFDSKTNRTSRKSTTKSTQKFRSTKLKSKNKAARKLPKEFIKSHANLKNQKRKIDYKRFFKHQAQTTPHPLAMEISYAEGSYIYDQNKSRI